MDRTSYENYITANPIDDRYMEVSVEDLIFRDNFVDIASNPLIAPIYVTEEFKDAVCRYVGMSPSLNKCLYEIDEGLWRDALNKLYKYHHKETIRMLISTSNGNSIVKGLVTTDREPVLARAFINDTVKFFDIYTEVEVSEILYEPDTNISSVTVLLVKKAEYNVRPYRLGVVFTNNELDSITARLVMKYDDGDYYYLPSKMYNLSSSRYAKTTSTSSEALNILLVRVSEDLLGTAISEKESFVTSRILESANKKITLQEYSALVTTLSNMSYESQLDESEIEDILSEVSTLNDFETIYNTLRSDYLWKCTALSGNSFDDMFRVIDTLPSSHVFYPRCLPYLRDLLGDYLMNVRICQMLANKP